uniref:VWA domain-containing protein n=1 Tax=Acidobacterium capsulatum TaxID=33075 RepID=A0A7V4XTM8_9BACT
MRARSLPMLRRERFLPGMVTVLAGLLLSAMPLHAQYDPPAASPGAPPVTAPEAKPEKKPRPPEAAKAPAAAAPAYQPGPELGGPDADSGAIAIPRRVTPPAPPVSEPEETVKNPPGLQHLALRVNAPLVNVDVGVVLAKTHHFVANLRKQNFELFENGVPQEIAHFRQVQAPITAVLLLEFAATNYNFIYDMQNAAYAFAEDLRPDDEIAVETFDMHTHLLTDFTQNKTRVMDALDTLTMPTWTETNLYDALYTTLDRLSRVQGRKYIILVASGIDSFSKINYDQVLVKIRQTPDVTIFAISTGHYARLMADGFGGMSPLQESKFLIADNQMQAFARMTGGQYFAPRFEAAMPDIFADINGQIRNQYEISYIPTDRKLDGTYRRIQVRLVNSEGQPLTIVNQKHRPLRYEVVAKEGYRAPMPVQ